MDCPICDGPTTVKDSRYRDESRVVRRRRECLTCGRRFTTYEYFGAMAEHLTPRQNKLISAFGRLNSVRQKHVEKTIELLQGTDGPA